MRKIRKINFHEYISPESSNNSNISNNASQISSLSDSDNLLFMPTPKQMLQRLPKAFAQVNAGNTSYINLLNDIKQIV